VDGEGANADFPMGVVERCDACAVYSSDLAALNETRKRAGLAPFTQDPTELIGADPDCAVEQTFEVGLSLSLDITTSPRAPIRTLQELRERISEAFIARLAAMCQEIEGEGDAWLADRLLVLSTKPKGTAATPPRRRTQRPQVPREQTITLLAPNDLPMPHHEIGGKNWCALATMTGSEISDRVFLKQGRGRNSYLLPDEATAGRVLERAAEPAGLGTLSGGDRYRYRYYYVIRERTEQHIVLAQAITRVGAAELAATILRLQDREQEQQQILRRRRVLDLDM
jgi:hypothetical protein